MLFLPLQELKDISIVQKPLLFRKCSTKTSKNDHFLMKKDFFVRFFSFFWELALAFFSNLCTVRLFKVYILFKKLNVLKVLAFVMNLWDYQLMNSKRIIEKM